MDAYREGVAAAVPTIRVGDPRDPETVMGALIREQQRRRVEGYVQSAHEEGAELLTGGKRPAGFDRGFFFEPTVFVGSNDMRIAQEEIFGPVLTVVPYSGTDKDAIRIANDSVYGLGGAVNAASTARAFNVARQIRAGFMMAVGVDGPLGQTAGKGGGQGPGWGEPVLGVGQRGVFGGYKQSGIGREWGHHGIEEFTELKQLTWL